MTIDTTDDTTPTVADELALREVDDGTYVVLHKRRPGHSVSTTVVLAVAAVLDEDPGELDPLAEVINPDALDDLVNSATEGAISFTYADCRVSIKCGGSIHLYLDSTQ